MNTQVFYGELRKVIQCLRFDEAYSPVSVRLRLRPLFAITILGLVPGSDLLNLLKQALEASDTPYPGDSLLSVLNRVYAHSPDAHTWAQREKLNRYAS
jgi:hypothetical protein